MLDLFGRQQQDETAGAYPSLAYIYNSCTEEIVKLALSVRLLCTKVPILVYMPKCQIFLTHGFHSFHGICLLGTWIFSVCSTVQGHTLISIFFTA